MLMSWPDCMKNLAPSTAATLGRRRWMIWFEVTVALVMRLQLDEDARGVFGRVVGAGAGKARRRRKPPGSWRTISTIWCVMLGHRRERDVLARLGLAEDEAGVLLGEKALRDRRRRDSRSAPISTRVDSSVDELVAEDEAEPAVVAAQHRLEAALGDAVEAGRADAALCCFRNSEHITGVRVSEMNGRGDHRDRSR